MANPNLKNLSTIYANSHVSAVPDTDTTIITCPTDKVYKVNSIQISSNSDPSGIYTISLGSNIYAQVQLNVNSITDVVINRPLYVTEGVALKVKSDISGGAATCTVNYETLSE